MFGPLRILTIVALSVVLVGFSALADDQFPSNVDGTWEGVFNGQPRDGNPEETQTPFRLQVQYAGHANLTGTLTILQRPIRKSRIKWSRCDPDGCSFEVVDYGDGKTPQAWRIWVKDGKLRGLRNRGPLGIPGVGGGARLFKIEGHVVKTQ
jgi:hypothetical protein